MGERGGVTGGAAERDNLSGERGGITGGATERDNLPGESGIAGDRDNLSREAGGVAGGATESTDPVSERAEERRDQDSEGASEADKKPVSDHHAATRENKNAIPYAGDTRLGEKHWGESKIVPDNPKARDSEAGISSAAGQPTSETPRTVLDTT